MSTFFVSRERKMSTFFAADSFFSFFLSLEGLSLFLLWAELMKLIESMKYIKGNRRGVRGRQLWRLWKRKTSSGGKDSRSSKGGERRACTCLRNKLPSFFFFFSLLSFFFFALLSLLWHDWDWLLLVKFNRLLRKEPYMMFKNFLRILSYKK